MKKTIVQKLYRDPNRFLYNETFFAYLTDLQDNGRLKTLPKNLYVYYVLSGLFGEVNNGGFSQYLYNSSRKTFYDLPECANALGVPELNELVREFVGAVRDFSDDYKPDGETEQYFEELDKRFYELDEKLQLDKLLKKYYKDNYTVNTITYEAVKEKPGEDCGYFIIPEKYKHVEPEEAVDCFLKLLSDFSTLKWKIDAYPTYEIFNIIASSSGDEVDLRTIIKGFGDPSFSFSGKCDGAYECRVKLCAYFGLLNFYGGTDGMSEYRVEIKPSGFDNGEMKMKHKFFLYGLAYDEPFFRIVTPSMPCSDGSETYLRIKNRIEEQHGKYKNIKSVRYTNPY